MANSVVDNGGKTLTTSLVVKSNTTYQNFAITGNGQFTSNGLAVSGVKFLNCTFKNITSIPIMIASWGMAPSSSDIEIAHCTMDSFSGQQYYFWLQNCALLNIHDNSFTNGTGIADAGLIFCQQSSGKFYRMYFDNYYGKAIRMWPALNSISAVYNIIAMNSTQYSGFEIQQTPGNTGWTVSFDNITGGNYALGANPIPTGLITVYVPNPAQMGYSVGASKGCIVFNTSLGKLLDNGNATVAPGAPTNANWQAVNKYYPTMQAAGFATPAAVLLPDGTAWNSTTPVPPIPPTPAAPKTVTTVTTVTDANSNVLHSQSTTISL